MRRTPVLAAFVLLPACRGTGYEETTYDGVDFSTVPLWDLS